MAEDEAFYDPKEGHGGATLTRPLRFAANAPVPPLLFELVLRQSAEAIFVCDKANRLVLVNDAARRLLGGDLEGKSIADVTGKWADFYEGGRCLRAEEVPLRRALAGETQIGRELQFVRRDGVVRTVLVNAAPVYDGGEIVAAVANHSEITSYRKSEERYRALVEAIPIGVIRSTVGGDIVDANDAFLSMVQYSRQELEAGRIRWGDLTPAEFLPLDEAAIAEAKHRGRCTPYEKAFAGMGRWFPSSSAIAWSGRSARKALPSSSTSRNGRRLNKHCARASSGCATCSTTCSPSSASLGSTACSSGPTGRLWPRPA